MFVAHRVCEQARILNEETILKHWASVEWICQFAVDSHAVCNSPLDKNKENKIRPKLSKEPVSFIHSPAVVVVVCCNLLFWFKFSYFFIFTKSWVIWQEKKWKNRVLCTVFKNAAFFRKKRKRQFAWCCCFDSREAKYLNFF